jgi:hypothetical protein
MSANGRYFTGDWWPAPGPTQYLDAQTGAVVDLAPSQTSYDRHLGIANDGTVLLRLFAAVAGAPSESLVLWRPGSTRTIYSDTKAVGATLSAEGGRIAFEAGRGRWGAATRGDERRVRRADCGRSDAVQGVRLVGEFLLQAGLGSEWLAAGVP